MKFNYPLSQVLTIVSFKEYDGLEFINSLDNPNHFVFLKEKNLLQFFSYIDGDEKKGAIQLNSKGHDLYDKILEDWEELSTPYKVYDFIDIKSLEFRYEFLYRKDQFGFENCVYLEDFIDFRPALVEYKGMFHPEKFFFMTELMEKDYLIENYVNLDYSIDQLKNPLMITQDVFKETIMTKKQIQEWFDDPQILDRIFDHGIFLSNKFFQINLEC